MPARAIARIGSRTAGSAQLRAVTWTAAVCGWSAGRRCGDDGHRRLGGNALGIGGDEGDGRRARRHRHGEGTTGLDLHRLSVGGQRRGVIDETAQHGRTFRRRGEDRGGHHQQRSGGVEREDSLDGRPAEPEPARLGHDELVRAVDDHFTQHLGADDALVATARQRHGLAVDLHADVAGARPAADDPQRERREIAAGDALPVGDPVDVERRSCRVHEGAAAHDESERRA